MTDIEKAKFFNVSGPIDHPTRSGKGIEVMFNPSTLKVTLANAISENQRGGNSRAAQYVDKSSSSLTVELIFDSSEEFDPKKSIRKDVRSYTGAIAKEFMLQTQVGNKKAEPKRCMFAWGTFVFTGIMESFDETLDLFAWEGTPLRATVAIKMTESRFQFETEDAKRAKRNTPRLGRDNDSAPDAASNAGQDPKGWRDTSMFNGVESPRMPGSPLAVPAGGGLGGALGGGASISGGIGTSGGAGISGGISGGVGLSGGISGGISGGAGISGGISGSAGFSGGASAGFSGGSNFSTASVSFGAGSVTPAFSFGASSSLGTGIPGAFTLNASGSMSAGTIKALSVTSSSLTTGNSSFSRTSTSGNINTRGTSLRGSGSLQITSGGIKASGGLGFD